MLKSVGTNLLRRRAREAPPAQIPASFRQSNIIFIHVPKCAGSSISLHLFGYRVGHTPVEEYWRRDLAFAQAAFKFSFVRHPYLRLWSAYRFLKNGGMTLSDARLVADHTKEFQSIGSLSEALEQRGALWNAVHFQPQHEFLSVPRGTGYNIYMDFVGKTEFLGRDLAYVEKYLPPALGGRLASIQSEPLNVSQSEDFVIDEGILRRVRRVYDFDFEVFGYDEWGRKDAIIELLNRQTRLTA